MANKYGAYELKATYQRNFLIGLLLPLLLAGVVGVLVWTDSDPTDSQSYVLRAGEQIHLRVAGRSQEPPAHNRTTDNQIQLKSGFPGNRMGFRVIAVAPGLAVSTHKRGREVLWPDVPPKSAVPEETAMPAENLPCASDYGIPEYKWSAGQFDTLWNFEMRGLVDRPLTIHLGEVKYPKIALGMRIEGEATVHLIVDPLGELVACELSAEHPRKLGFGKALKQAIQDAWYEPAVAYHQRVSSEIDFTYHFVCSQNSATKVETKGGVQVVYVGK